MCFFSDEMQLKSTESPCNVRWNVVKMSAWRNEQIATIIDDMGLNSGKGPGEMAVITSTEGAQVTFGTFFSYSINIKEVWWCWAHFSGWCQIVPQSKERSNFSSGKTWKNSTTWPANSQNLWWGWEGKEMVRDKSWSHKADLSTDVHKSWNLIDENWELQQ